MFSLFATNAVCTCNIVRELLHNKVSNFALHIIYNCNCLHMTVFVSDNKRPQSEFSLLEGGVRPLGLGVLINHLTEGDVVHSRPPLKLAVDDAKLESVHHPS